MCVIGEPSRLSLPYPLFSARSRLTSLHQPRLLLFSPHTAPLLVPCQFRQTRATANSRSTGAGPGKSKKPQMSNSILNQAFTPPIGQGLGKTGSSPRPHDGSAHNLPLNIASSLPGSSCSLKSSQQMNTHKPSYSLTGAVETAPPWLYQDADLSIPMDARSFPGTNTRFSPLCSGLLSIKDHNVETHQVLASDPVADLLGEHNFFSAEFTATLAVTVSSAVELDQRQIDQIKRKMQRLTGFKNLKLENHVDPSLIAGFVVRYGSDDSHVIDLSVKGQLTQLSARIESSENRRVEQEQKWSFLI